MMAYLRREGIVFEWRGHNSVKSSILEAIKQWEHLRKGGQVSAEECVKMYAFFSSGTGVKRGYKTLPGFAPDAMLDMMDLKGRGGLQTDKIWHEAMDRIPQEEKSYLLRALKRGESLNKKPRVRVSTIHGAKGGEADHVVILRDMAPRTYNEMRDAPDDEARVWYVAATRAKRELSVVAPRTNLQYTI
jgi:superfamily I DNA/RNA helicase